MINWYDNIPLISFIILKAKCRSCSTKISSKYFLVELISAISFVFIFYLFGFSLTTLLLFILSISFIIIFFIDLKHFIIPNEITYPLMVIGFIKSFDPNLNMDLFPNFMNSLIGGLFGYMIIWLIIFIYKKLRDKEGMGLGDAKLLSVIGFWFGWVSIPFVIFFSSTVALLSALPDLERRDMILIAGTTPEGNKWVGSMGNYMGTFVEPFLKIPPNGHLVHMRYHEFFCIEEKIII